MQFAKKDKGTNSLKILISMSRFYYVETSAFINKDFFIWFLILQKQQFDNWQ